MSVAHNEIVYRGLFFLRMYNWIFSHNFTNSLFSYMPLLLVYKSAFIESVNFQLRLNFRQVKPEETSGSCSTGQSDASVPGSGTEKWSLKVTSLNFNNNYEWFADWEFIILLYRRIFTDTGWKIIMLIFDFWLLYERNIETTAYSSAYDSATIFVAYLFYFDRIS